MWYFSAGGYPFNLGRRQRADNAERIGDRRIILKATLKRHDDTIDGRCVKVVHSGISVICVNC